MKSVVGLMLGLLIGAACRWFEIPGTRATARPRWGDSVNVRKTPFVAPIGP